MKILPDYRPKKIQRHTYLHHRFQSNDLNYKDKSIYKFFPCLIQLRLNTVLKNIWVFEIIHRLIHFAPLADEFIGFSLL